jgi:hypothetical protein
MFSPNMVSPNIEGQQLVEVMPKLVWFGFVDEDRLGLTGNLQPAGAIGSRLWG